MRVLPGERRNINDISAAPPLHHRNGVVAGIEHTEKIGFESLPKFISGQIFDRLVHDADAGIVYENVDTAKTFFTAFEHGLHLVLDPHIAKLSRNLAKSRKLPDRRFDIVTRTGADKYTRSFPSQALRDREADAFRSARYDCSFAA